MDNYERLVASSIKGFDVGIRSDARPIEPKFQFWYDNMPHRSTCQNLPGQKREGFRCHEDMTLCVLEQIKMGFQAIARRCKESLDVSSKH